MAAPSAGSAYMYPRAHTARFPSFLHFVPDMLVFELRELQFATAANNQQSRPLHYSAAKS